MSVFGCCSHCVNYRQQLSLELSELTRHHCCGKLLNEVSGFPVTHGAAPGSGCGLCAVAEEPNRWLCLGLSSPGSRCGGAPGTEKWLVT